jgi:hypothetical protein
MIGDPHPYSVGSDDDDLHEPTSAHPWWTETFWLSFGIPNRRMQISVYPWFRTNIGLQAGGILVWDASNELPWDMVFCDYDFHIPLDPHVDLRHAQLKNGLTLDCLETQRTYRVRYEHDELTFDVTFRGLMEPFVSGSEGKATHLDQSGQVTGEMVLRGERIRIDAPGMRDRSWAVRLTATRVDYAWGTTPAGEAFLCVSLPTTDREAVCDGYLLRDDEPARLTDGQRWTSRSLGHPDSIRIDATDALGRRLAADGVCVNRLAFSAYPGTFAWDSMVRWDLNGREAWGEDQDVWTVPEWRSSMAGGR